MNVTKVPHSLVGPYESAFFPESYEDVTAGVDTTAAIQSAIDAASSIGGGVVILKPGRVYQSNGGLLHRKNVRISGYGSTLKALPTWAPNANLIKNADVAVADNQYNDTGIVLEGLKIDGSDVARGDGSALAYVKCDAPVMRDVMITGVRFIGAAFAGCRDAVITQNTVEKCGKALPSANPGDPYLEGGASIWTGKFGNTPNLGTKITGNTFRDLLWSGVYLNDGAYVVCSDNNFRNCGEASIFMNSGMFGFEVCNNNITDSTVRRISPHGIECGGSRGVISGNNISNVPGCGISLQHGSAVTVSGNNIIDFGSDNSPARAAPNCGIMFLGSVGDAPSGFNATGNTIITLKSYAYAGIAIVSTGGVTPANVFQSSNVVLGGPWSSGSPIFGFGP